MAEKKEYLHTHPWITFQVNTDRILDYRSWLLLGEAKSKCEHVIGAPLLPEMIQNFMTVALAKGVLATTAIEGNTLSEEEVRARIEHRLDLPPSKEYLGQEIDNIIEAINLIGQKLLDNTIPVDLSVEDILTYNQLTLKDLPLSEGVIPGKIRNFNVGVGGYKGAPYQDCLYLLELYVQWLNAFTASKNDRIVYGILKAILAHLYFVWIHPFGDGNGRTARLIEFQILISSGVPAVAAHILSNHYNNTRAEYYRFLSLANRGEDGIRGFVNYALQGFVDGLKAEISLIQEQQIKVHWINHIHNQFRGKSSETQERQKELILELTKGAIVVNLKDVRYRTPRIAEMYATRSELTLKRDLDELIDLGLLDFDREQKVYLMNLKVLQIRMSPVRD